MRELHRFRSLLVAVAVGGATLVGGAGPLAAVEHAPVADQAPPDDPQLPVNPDADPEGARQAADEILAGDEYRAPDTRDRTVVDRIRDWIGDRLPDLDGDGVQSGSNVVSYVVLVVVLLGAVAALTFVLTGTRRRRRAPDADADADIDLTPLRTTREWDAEAERCEAAGDHRGAVRARFRALTTTLAARGVVADTPGRTAGELRDDVAVRAPTMEAPFGAVADLFEQVWYGDRPATAGESSAAHDLARAALDAAPKRVRADDDAAEAEAP